MAEEVFHICDASVPLIAASSAQLLHTRVGLSDAARSLLRGPAGVLFGDTPSATSISPTETSRAGCPLLVVLGLDRERRPALALLDCAPWWSLAHQTFADVGIARAGVCTHTWKVLPLPWLPSNRVAAAALLPASLVESNDTLLVLDAAMGAMAQLDLSTLGLTTVRLPSREVCATLFDHARRELVTLGSDGVLHRYAPALVPHQPLAIPLSEALAALQQAMVGQTAPLCLFQTSHPALVRHLDEGRLQLLPEPVAPIPSSAAAFNPFSEPVEVVMCHPKHVLVLRSSPDSSEESRVTQMRRGERALAIGSQGPWLKLKLASHEGMELWGRRHACDPLGMEHLMLCEAAHPPLALDALDTGAWTPLPLLPTLLESPLLDPLDSTHFCTSLLLPAPQALASLTLVAELPDRTCTGAACVEVGLRFHRPSSVVEGTVQVPAKAWMAVCAWTLICHRPVVGCLLGFPSSTPGAGGLLLRCPVEFAPTFGSSCWSCWETRPWIGSS
jgi:hypothetical protein